MAPRHLTAAPFQFAALNNGMPNLASTVSVEQRVSYMRLVDAFAKLSASVSVSAETQNAYACVPRATVRVLLRTVLTPRRACPQQRAPTAHRKP